MIFRSQTNLTWDRLGELIFEQYAMATKIQTALTDIWRNIGPLIVRYRFGLLVCAVVVYAFWPKYSHISTDKPNEPVKNVHDQPLDEGPSTYDPNAPDANPKWGLPVELQSKDLQAFAKKVEAFERTLKEAETLDDERQNLLGDLLDEKVKAMLLPAVKGGGFRDQKLPLDWYELVKNNYQVADAPGMLADLFGKIGVITTFNARLESIHVRLIGGKLIAGDLLFINGNDDFVKGWYDKVLREVHQMQNVGHRLVKEFPDLELRHFADQPSGKLSSDESLPSASKTKNDAFDDLQASGVKSLILGCSLSSAPVG
jgi:hypothetical protein